MSSGEEKENLNERQAHIRILPCRCGLDRRCYKHYPSIRPSEEEVLGALDQMLEAEDISVHVVFGKGVKETVEKLTPIVTNVTTIDGGKENVDKDKETLSGSEAEYQDPETKI